MANAYLRVQSTGVRRAVVAGVAVVAMSVSLVCGVQGVGRGGWREDLRGGAEVGDRDQGKAGVAELGQETVKGGLVQDGAS